MQPRALTVAKLFLLGACLVSCADRGANRDHPSVAGTESGDPSAPSASSAAADEPEALGQGNAMVSGLVLGFDPKADRWVVHSVLPLSPAAAAGIVPGDQLLAINGVDLPAPPQVSCAGAACSETVQALFDGVAQSITARTPAAYSVRRGQAESRYSLRVERLDRITARLDEAAIAFRLCGYRCFPCRRAYGLVCSDCTNRCLIA